MIRKGRRGDHTLLQRLLRTHTHSHTVPQDPGVGSTTLRRARRVARAA